MKKPFEGPRLSEESGLAQLTLQVACSPQQCTD